MRTLSVLLLLATALAASPASAGCVSCGPGGECFDASPGFSANCECRIRSVGGVATCKPSGICDPTDSNTCDGDPWLNVAAGPEISMKFMTPLSLANPRVAGAIWGAVTETGVSSSPRMRPGTYSGTMGQEGRSYTFETQVRQSAADSFHLAIRIEEEGTGQVEEFEATLLHGGRTGRILRDSQREGSRRVYSWRAGDL